MTESRSITPPEPIDRRLLMIRGHRVILDADLARLYGVPTKRLNEQVKRNSNRFPEDFMFRLTAGETVKVVAICDHLARLRFSPVLPHAFMEHGVIMAANVLNSRRAVEAGIFVVRAFVRFRQVLATHRELAGKLAELEGRMGTHDGAIGNLMAAIRQLMEPPPEPSRERIGFRPRRSGPGIEAPLRGKRR